MALISTMISELSVQSRLIQIHTTDLIIHQRICDNYIQLQLALKLEALSILLHPYSHVIRRPHLYLHKKEIGA